MGESLASTNILSNETINYRRGGGNCCPRRIGRRLSGEHIQCQTGRYGPRGSGHETRRGKPDFQSWRTGVHEQDNGNFGRHERHKGNRKRLSPRRHKGDIKQQGVYPHELLRRIPHLRQSLCRRDTLHPLRLIHQLGQELGRCRSQPECGPQGVRRAAHHLMARAPQSLRRRRPDDSMGFGQPQQGPRKRHIARPRGPAAIPRSQTPVGCGQCHTSSQPVGSRSRRRANGTYSHLRQRGPCIGESHRRFRTCSRIQRGRSLGHKRKMEPRSARK